MVRNPTKVILLVIVLCVGCLFARTIPSAAQGGRFALTITNGTGRDFHRLHVAWTRDKDWGPNLLQSVLRPRTSVVQRNMVPAEYDLLLVDSKGAQCTLPNVQVYNDKAVTVAEDNCR